MAPTAPSTLPALMLLPAPVYLVDGELVTAVALVDPEVLTAG